jgi:phosphate starvation-inducible PhoH-like protein
MAKNIRRSKRVQTVDYYDDMSITYNADYHMSLDIQKTHHQPKQIELETLTPSQVKYLNSIKNNIVTIAHGSAGTGKSWCAATYASQQLLAKRYKKIIITRPAVECGEKLGFLPGDINEKYREYLTPLLSIFHKTFGHNYTEYLIKTKAIDARPLAFMRGTTFEDCIVILDESQNLSKEQMLMFLTRIGQNCKIIINGDTKQSDIRGTSGLEDAIKRIGNVDKVGVVEFTTDDIVRSGIMKDILIAYQK